MITQWWAAFPPVEAGVTCGAAQHTVRWADGRLIPLDHPDPEGEKVLVALGGEQSACMATVQAWESHQDDLDVLMLGPRFPGEHLAVGGKPDEDDDWLMSLLPGGTGRPRPAVSPAGRPGLAGQGRKRRAELLDLLALGEPFQLRLTAAVVASAGHDDPAAVPALIAALAGRVAPAAGAWLGLEADEVRAVPHEGTGWGSVRLDGAGPDRLLTIVLPIDWLARVWAPGLAVVDGHLVVDVLDMSLPEARVLGLRRPGSEPVELAVRHRAGRWRLGEREGDQ